MVLLAIGAIPDNFLQSIAGVLMIASTVWIAVAAGRRGAPASMATVTDHSHGHLADMFTCTAAAARARAAALRLMR